MAIKNPAIVPPTPPPVSYTHLDVYKRQEPPGARMRVALTGLTMAEYFRDQENQDVLLFIDNIFRFTQAGSEVSALLGRIPSAVGYQPTLATEMGALQERITSTKKGSITSVQAVYVPVSYTHLDVYKRQGFTLTVAVGISLLFFIVAELFPHQILRIFTRFPEVIDTGVDYVRICAPTFIMLAITQPFTIALRATQQTRLPLYASVIAIGTNTFLNYVFIFGKFGAPAMGCLLYTSRCV